MKTFYLLTAFGKDRPGMVSQVTRLVFQRGGSIDDASMTRLGGEFAMMLVVSLPKAATGARFLRDLPALQKQLGLSLNAKPITAGLAHAKHLVQATHLITIYGTDKPGIVYKAAQVLAAQRVNITDLNTRILRRAGKVLYLMLLEVQIPSRQKATALKKTLQRLGRTLRLDVTVQDLDPVTL